MSTLPGSTVRLIDVARAAGVSRVAAAHVLNGAGSASVRVSLKTRQRIETIAESMNYRPNRAAQQLRGMPSGLIGVIFDSQWPTNHARLSEECDFSWSVPGGRRFVRACRYRKWLEPVGRTPRRARTPTDRSARLAKY